jgi:hypothetical protein
MLSTFSQMPDGSEIEDPRKWVEQLHTNMETLAFSAGLPETSLKRTDRFQSIKVQSRLQDIHAIIERISPWFDYYKERSWLWFRSTPIPAFDNKSASEVLRECGSQGLIAIHDYIGMKEAGGFE